MTLIFLASVYMSIAVETSPCFNFMNQFRKIDYFFFFALVLIFTVDSSETSPVMNLLLKHFAEEPSHSPSTNTCLPSGLKIGPLFRKPDKMSTTAKQH